LYVRRLHASISSLCFALLFSSSLITFSLLFLSIDPTMFYPIMLSLLVVNVTIQCYIDIYINVNLFESVEFIYITPILLDKLKYVLKRQYKTTYTHWHSLRDTLYVH
jgi:hypothetical protein